MNSSIATEEELEILVRRVMDSNDPEFAIKILKDEITMFEILSNLSYKGVPQLKVKLSFCIIILLVDHWKRLATIQDLPPMFYNYFNVTGKFIYFTYNKSSCNKQLEIYSESLLEQSADNSQLLLFVPDKFINEKRLYRITLSDIERISCSRSWSKLPDPHNCQSWIKLPLHFNISGKTESSNRLSNDLICRAETRQESVAKKLIFRNNSSSRKPTVKSDTQKTSIFKRQVDHENAGGTKSTTHSSPSGGIEMGIEPVGVRLSDLSKRIRTQISQSTKPTSSDSPGLSKNVAHPINLTKVRKESPVRSLSDINCVSDEPRVNGKLKRYTLIVENKSRFPT